MKEPLILLRIIGALSGAFLLLWVFARFRQHLIKTREFFLFSLIGISLVIVTIFPDSINIIVGMLSLEDKQFGRLITLLIFSNLALWALVFALRIKDAKKTAQFDLFIRRVAYDRFLTGQDFNSIKEITVIIPVLNEAENLDNLLPKIPRLVNGRPLSVLVVDDGSTDNTVEIVKKHGFLIASNLINRGGGAALRLGYDIAAGGGAKIVVTMDGDGQHLPNEIEGLVEPIYNGSGGFVIGSRVLGQREKDSVVRWVGIHFFNFIINTLAGTKITDCSSGFRAFRVDLLQKVLLLQDQFHTAELIIDAAKKGIRIVEAPITVVRRYSGESKKGKNWTYGLNFLKTVVKTRFRR